MAMRTAGDLRRPQVLGRMGQKLTRPTQDAPEEDEGLSAEGGFARTLEEGQRRLGRSWSALTATGVVGGIDVATGVLGLLIVEHATGSKLLGGLAFGIGFIALTLARSELFTENFLVPVIAIAAKRCTWTALLRLWTGTAVFNLLGGWIVTALIIEGFPNLRPKAVELGKFYVDIGLGWRAFALALLGGLVITLMTWMQHTTESIGGKVTAAVTAAFLLGAGSLNHAIVASLLMFAALHTGHAGFTYGDWAMSAGWAALGNSVGGIGLVTLLRLLQVPHRLQEAREEA
jgi:formate/nitrite transporter FocA (FNT family)